MQQEHAENASVRDRGDPHAQLILEGHPWRVVWHMAWPAVAVMVAFGLNTVMDAVYIGQLIGEQALAGAVLAYPVTQITLGLGSLAGIGGGVALSIAIGRGDHDVVRRLPGTALAIAGAMALLYALIGGLFAESLVYGMGARDDLIPIAAAYLRASALGGIGAIAGMTLNMLLRGEGKMKLAAGYMGLGLAANVALTPIFIVVFDWGVAGAAWATNIGGAIGGMLVWRRYLLGHASYPVDAHFVGLPRKLTARIVRLGTPAMIMSSMGLVQAIVVFNMLARIGNEHDIAFFGAAWRLLLFIITPLFGLMRAFQPVAGMNYGAGQWQRVQRHYWTFVAAGAMMIVPIWILMNLFPDPVLGLMLPEAAFSAADLHHFRVLMLVLPVLPIVFTALALLPAIEQPGKATTVSISRQLLLYAPVMLVLPQFIGISGIYYGSTAIDFLCALWLLTIVLTTFSGQRSRNERILR